MRDPHGMTRRPVWSRLDTPPRPREVELLAHQIEAAKLRAAFGMVLLARAELCSRQRSHWSR
jgi:hypothetical protein